MNEYILLIVFGGLMGYLITDEWIIRPLKRKIKHQEKEYKDLLQESLGYLLIKEISNK
tara:strand:+ start:155 stop:328 length:174 start_codon:yes stop_codon:yes gene_type:complete